MNENRQSMLQSVTDRLLTDGVTTIGINGVDGSGKTVFTSELAEQLRSQSNREVLSFSIDDFHHPQLHRYKSGTLSARGFYEDSFNKQALIDKVLHPLKQGDRHYQSKHFDHRIDKEVNSPPKRAAQDSIAIIEGVFC